MKAYPVILFLFLGSGILFSLPTYSLTLVDDHQNTITLTQTARRIISLTPHITDSLNAIGAHKSIVGIISADHNGPESATVIGNEQGVDVERLIALKPDLIIAWGSGSMQTIERLRKTGIPVFITDPRASSDILQATRQFGLLTGHTEESHTITQQWEKRLIALKRQYAAKRSVSVFLEVWPLPLMTIGKASILNEAIQLCGGRNIFHDQSRASLTVSVESVLIRNPQVIIGLLPKEQGQDFIHKWSQQKRLKAVQHRQIRLLDIDALSRPGPTFFAGNEALCRLIDRAR